MARGNWNKHINTQKHILNVLRRNNHLTTNGIKKKLESEFNVYASWGLVDRYLQELRRLERVEVQVIEGINRISVWNLKLE